MPKFSKICSKKTGTIFVLTVIVLGGLAFGTALWGRYLAQPGPLAEEKTVQIATGTSVSGMAEQLTQNNVITSPLVFKGMVKISGLSGSLQAGEYVFPPKVSLRQVVNMLATGHVTDRMAVFYEGLTSGEILNIIKDLNMKGDVPNKLPEGSLFPDTYAYQVGTERMELVDRLQRKASQSLQLAWTARSADNPLKSPLELLTLASIIQKESNYEPEMAKIAGVFINRLNKGMKLQSDATVIYGASNYNGNLTTTHLREDQPYNTYVRTGLPPSPIANVGNAALMAAAQPEQHDFLFFVVDGTKLGSGKHVFSRTYQEHQRHVATYVQAYREKYHGE